MRKRKRLWNKTVAIAMIFLMITTGLIQPVSAEGSNLPVECPEPVGNEGSNLPVECLEPVGNEGSNLPAEGSEPVGNEGSNPPAEDSEAAGDEGSNLPAEGSEPVGNEGSNPPAEDSEAAGDEGSNPPVEGSEAAGDEGSNPPAEGSEVVADEGSNPPVESPELVSANEVSPNALGELTKDGKSLPGVTFSIYNQADKIWYDSVTDQNGNFGFTLPDGEYLLYGIWLDSESKWYPLEVSFTVQNGAVVNPEQLNLDLTEKGPNVNGSILKDGQPVAGALMNARTATGAEKWYDAKTDANGNYQLYLPDGEYQIIGVWVESESKWYPLEVSFTVQKGEVVNPEQINLDLTEKGPNVNGSVVKGGPAGCGCFNECTYCYWCRKMV